VPLNGWVARSAGGRKHAVTRWRWLEWPRAFVDSAVGRGFSGYLPRCDYPAEVAEGFSATGPDSARADAGGLLLIAAADPLGGCGFGCGGLRRDWALPPRRLGPRSRMVLVEFGTRVLFSASAGAFGGLHVGVVAGATAGA